MHKSMVGFLTALSVCTLLFSCESLRWDVLPPVQKEERPVYAAAFAYPESYDWKKDSLGGKAGARLLFYRDSTLLLDLEAVPENGISQDADMHHIVGSDLYCEYSSSDGTVLSKNGTELFAFSGRQMLAGIVAVDTSLFTLWEDRSGDGWTYRENGRVVLWQESSSALLSSLYEDEGELCFAYSVALASTGGQSSVKRYYIVEGGRPRLLQYGADIDEILCVRRHCGADNYLAESQRLGSLLWQSGEQTAVVDVGKASAIGECSFEKSGGELLAHAQVKLEYDGILLWNDCYWRRDGLAASTVYGGQVCAMCHESPVLCFACSPSGGTSVISVYYNGASEKLASNLRLTSPYALCCDREGWVIGVNDSDGNNKPLIINGQDSTSYGFNGYFTQLSLP